MYTVSAAGPANVKRHAARGLRAHLAPLSAILLAHLLLFYALYTGAWQQVARQVLTQETFVSLVTSPPAPAPKREPAAPKTLAPSVPQPTPVLPAPSVVHIDTTPPPALTPASDALSAPAVVAPVAPTPAPMPAAPKTVSVGVEYLRAPVPDYPSVSRRMGEQGKVVLRILVNEKGLPEQVAVQTSSGSGRLDEAARQAALRALFKPHLEDGRAVAVFVLVPLNFELSR